RAVVHLRQRQGQGIPAGFHPRLGSAADRGLPGVFPAPAIAAEHDRIGNGTTAESHVSTKAKVTVVTAADRRTPVGPDVTGVLVRGDAIIEDDIGPGDTADRAILVVDRRAPPGIGAA